MKKFFFAILMVFFSGFMAAEAAAANDSAEVDQELSERLLKKNSPAVCQVDYYFRLDKYGKSPNFSIKYFCPNCNNYHYDRVSGVIEGKNAVSIPGFAVGDRKVITTDLNLIPEWIERIEVRQNGKVYPAVIQSYYPERMAIALSINDPEAKLSKIEFNGKKDGKLYHFFVTDDYGIPFAGVVPYRGDHSVVNLAGNVRYHYSPENTVICDSDGNAVTLGFRRYLALRDRRLDSPEKWKMISAAERDRTLEEKKKFIIENFFPVSIVLSPPENRGNRMMLRHSQMSESDKNEFYAIGMLLPDGRVLVRAKFSPEQTGRLENIVLTLPDGNRIAAEFVGSLKDWGAIVVMPEKKISGKGIEFFRGKMAGMFEQPVNMTAIRNMDGKIDVTIRPGRVEKFQKSYGNRIVPLLENFSTGKDLLFSNDMKLLLFPLSRQGMVNSYGNDTKLLDGGALADIFSSASPFDPDNIPRKGKDRLAQSAWLGVELQELNSELARNKNVSALTDDGEKGGLITRVRENSPAASAGLKEGDILLYYRYANGQNIELASYEIDSNDLGMQFPWKEYDKIPEQYFEMIPTPWPNVMNSLNTQLSRIGVGKKITLGVISDGKFEEKELTLGAMPLHFGTAERYNASDFGFSAANATFEVREYFRMKPDDPGVIVSRVAPGSRASVAGLRPYEIILDVDGVAVRNVEELKKLLSGKSKVSLTVRRMTVNRVVKFN